MKLHGFWRSSATWRVRIALAHKRVDYTYVPLDLLGRGEQRGPEHHRRNPMEQVPVLELSADEAGGGPAHLAQSVAILEYLEERFPAPPLLPGDAVARARVRQLVEVVNSGIQPLQNAGIQRHLAALGVDSEAWIRHFVGRGLRALEEMTAPVAGRFSVGDQLSFADLMLVPELAFARRFGVELGAMPTLLRVEAACEGLGCFQVSRPELQPDAPREPR